MKLGDRIRQLRDEIGLTQGQLAARLLREPGLPLPARKRRSQEPFRRRPPARRPGHAHRLRRPLRGRRLPDRAHPARDSTKATNPPSTPSSSASSPTSRATASAACSSSSRAWSRSSTATNRPSARTAPCLAPQSVRARRRGRALPAIRRPRMADLPDDRHELAERSTPSSCRCSPACPAASSARPSSSSWSSRTSSTR